MILRGRYNYSSVPQTLEGLFFTLTKAGKGASQVDWINTNRTMIYVCMDKHTVNAYLDYSYYNDNNNPKNRMAYTLKRDRIIVYDREVLGNSCYLLGHKFHENVNLVNKWSIRDIAGQGYLTAKNVKKPIPVGWEVIFNENVDYTNTLRNDEIGYYNMRYAHNKDVIESERRIPLVFSYDGDLLVKPKIGKFFKKIDKLFTNASRDTRNRRARSRYHNRRAEDRVAHKDYRMEDVFLLHNVSIRREVIEHFGMDTVLASLESTVLDTDIIDGREYSLVSVKIPDINDESGFRHGNYLRMINPSTDEIHFEGVPNKWEAEVFQSQSLEDNTVRHALAWRDNEQDGYNVPVVLT